MARTIFAVPLATLGERIDDELAIAQLADAIRASSSPQIFVRRYPF
jgi:hypothetical protein